MAHAESRGREASRPKEIPTAGWGEILRRVYAEMTADHVSIVAAGVAFFGLLAIFPSIGALMALAAFVFDPSTIQSQIDQVAAVLPEDAASIIRDQAAKMAEGAGGGALLGAIIGLLLALYGASKGMKTLIEGMNIAYDEEEKRGFLALNLSALALTLLLILGVLIAFAVVIAAPALLATLGLGSTLESWITYGRWPLLALFTIFGLAVIYRYGPSRRNPRWRWVSPGAVAATLLWVVGSILFSIYVRNFGSYNATYGALAGVIILLTWLWLSAFIILMGAELNAETEHQTRRDSTVGPDRPMGERGAMKADTLPRSGGGREGL